MFRIYETKMCPDDEMHNNNGNSIPANKAPGNRNMMTKRKTYNTSASHGGPKSARSEQENEQPRPTDIKTKIVEST